MIFSFNNEPHNVVNVKKLQKMWKIRRIANNESNQGPGASLLGCAQRAARASRLGKPDKENWRKMIRKLLDYNKKIIWLEK